MARTREFDPETALEAAMKVFWRNGYYATSIDDLVAGTGVSRYGLYNVYENKRTLFLAALDHYVATVLRDLLVPLTKDGASLGDVAGLITKLGEIAAQPSGRLGCLLWNSASEVAPHDKTTARKVSDFRALLATGFETALTAAVAKGELKRGFDARREADFLAGVVQTLAVFARSRAEPGVIANFVDVSLGTLH